MLLTRYNAVVWHEKGGCTTSCYRDDGRKIWCLPATLRGMLLPTPPPSTLGTVHSHPSCCSSLCGCGLPSVLPWEVFWPPAIPVFTASFLLASLTETVLHQLVKSVPTEPQKQRLTCASHNNSQWATVGQATFSKQQCGFLYPDISRREKAKVGAERWLRGTATCCPVPALLLAFKTYILF